jgi:hypothetical protein
MRPLREGPTKRLAGLKLKTTFRCWALRRVLVNGEGKGPIRSGQVTSRKRAAREATFSCRKERDDVAGQRIVGMRNVDWRFQKT